MSQHTFHAYKQDGKPVITSDHRDAFAGLLETFADGEDLAITLGPWEDTRSNKQNAALHAALTEWSRHKAYPGASNSVIKEVVEQIKDDLLALQFGYIVRQNQFTGEVIKALVKSHTSKLTVSEFCDLFDLAASEAAKQHHVMVMPKEYLEAKAAKAKKAARAEKRTKAA